MSDINPNKKDENYSPTESAQRWDSELERALGAPELKRFHDTSRKIVKKYIDRREDGGDGVFKLNLFWSNVQVLKSTLYSRPPKVDVSRRFKDFNDDEGRVAGTILERILNAGLEDDYSDFDVTARLCIEDYLIVGMAQAWARYEVETQQFEMPPEPVEPMGEEPGEVAEGAAGEPEVYEQVTKQSALTDYVHWSDFAWSPARIWEEVTWVARRVYMTRDQLKKRFGAKIGGAVPISQQKKASEQGEARVHRGTAQVWEIWDRTTRKVYWHCKGMATVLDMRDDPLQLREFFPCPRPLVTNTTTSLFMPRADFTMAQDQYDQIDEMTTRIAYLTRACKVVGIYDKTATGVSRMFQEGLENQLIPVDQWAAFAEKGGIKGAVDWVPVEQVASVIERLTSQREILVQKLYEVLGIGDIMRGMSNPDETATAQQIKAQFGSTRLQFKQFEIGRWVSDVQRIKGEIIAKHFTPEIIKRDSGIEHTPDAPFADAGIALLKSPEARYRITIDSETMATLDWAAERDARTQFLQAIGGYVQSIAPMVQQAPQAAPMLIEMLKWGLGGFKVGKEIESVLDQAIAAAQQPSPPSPPDPKTQAEIDEKQASAQRQRASGVKDMTEARQKQIENQMMEPGAGLLPSGTLPPGMAPAAPPPGTAMPGMGPMQ